MKNQIRSLPALAIAAVLAVTVWSSWSPPLAAHYGKPTDAPSMTTGSMDSSKMGDMKGMKGMDGMSMTGDADYDFAVNMKKHHQMALDMAQGEVKDGKNPQMVKMAKSIIATQTKEIAAFDRWLAANPKR